MSTVTYDRIAANIESVQQNGAQVIVRWKDPATGRSMGESSAGMVADNSLSGRVQSNVKHSIVSEVVYGAARFIGGLLGGAAGRVVSNAAYSAASDIRSRATDAISYGEAERQAAVVQAFQSVAAGFVWDEASGRYVARPG